MPKHPQEGVSVQGSSLYTDDGKLMVASHYRYTMYTSYKGNTMKKNNTIQITTATNTTRNTCVHGVINTYQGDIYIAGTFRKEVDGRVHLKVEFVSNQQFQHLIGNEHNFEFLSYGLFDAQ